MKKYNRFMKPGDTVYHKETYEKGKILRSYQDYQVNGKWDWLVTWESGHGRAYKKEKLLTEEEFIDKEKELKNKKSYPEQN